MTAGGGTAYRLAALLLAFPSHMYLPERESQTGLAHSNQDLEVSGCFQYSGFINTSAATKSRLSFAQNVNCQGVLERYS